MMYTVDCPRYLILLGGPGAGKGTQAQWLTTYLAIPHLSSGDLFREHVRSRTDLGVTAKSYMDRGELVPDYVTVAMVMERVGRVDCCHGAILDGFPRTVPQAEALDQALAAQGKSVGLVLDLVVPFDILVARLTERWLCRVCGASFHTEFAPPTVAGQCDHCGNALYQRDDDKPDTVRNRLEVYTRQTAPLEDFYRRRGLLVEIDGGQPVAVVQQSLVRALQKLEVVGIRM